ncbi:bifunctional chorismate mutase/prephenate dehydratase [uncultured Olegusella sp.]|uniref:bifunctional chorismate mutase/prephenate dehydratase n=1 Tax=uncultured Olegusella sp. TaxID=1979846 RepID=UPI0026059FC9|nr:bifunctional chorismate mutase/prephenate dehydratase [uncultured Olegusella sp.]
MADISELRKHIDRIDDDILELFKERMDVAHKVAAYKAEHKLPVFNRDREHQILVNAAAKVPKDQQAYVQVLMSLLMEASRSRQTSALGHSNQVVANINEALKESPELFPRDAFVACQGVEGAYSQIATDCLFKHANISYFDTFDGVFRAVDQGFSDYGVLPIENSSAGSVNEVYDLMMQYDFHIVRTCRLKVDHNLLAKPGTKLEDIREIYSHEQAVAQSMSFLQSLPHAQVHVVENTAAASKLVANSERSDVAALASRACAELYGLVPLAQAVQDRDDNYTRFACITKKLTVYPGADRSSLMLVVGNEPGALFKVLAKFYALDINIIKLESRPILGKDFEFMFYFDVDCPVVAPEFTQLMSTLGNVCEDMRYLGSYREVI